MYNFFSLHNNNLRYITSLFLTDIVAYIISILTAYITRLAFDSFSFVTPLEITISEFFYQSWWILIFYILMNISFGSYFDRQPFWMEARSLAKAVMIVFIIVFAFVSLVKVSDYVSRLLLLLLWFYLLIFSIIFRFILRKLLYDKPFFCVKTVLIGSLEEAMDTMLIFDKEKDMGFSIAGIIITDTSDTDNIHVLGTLSELDNIIDSNSFYAAILLPSFNSVANNHLIASKLQLKLSKIYFINHKQRIAFANVKTMQTFRTDLSMVQINNNITSIINRFIKRTLDISLCTLALPFLIVITILISLAIKFTSKGKVFFKQERIGIGGKKIYVYKFRSMYSNADERLKIALSNDENLRKEWERLFKLKNDPRVSRVGRFLRKSSLDELPQLFNVLKGDMSLVGPRPIVQKEINEYYKEYAEYYKMVRPGITGIWQISGRNNTTYDYRIAKDTWYVLNWSVWLDLVILLETPKVVFKGEGAY